MTVTVTVGAGLPGDGGGPARVVSSPSNDPCLIITPPPENDIDTTLEWIFLTKSYGWDKTPPPAQSKNTNTAISIHCLIIPTRAATP